MRSNFEKDLSGFSTLAKEERKEFNMPEDVERFQRVLDRRLGQAAQLQGTSVENQRKIYEVQKEKQKIMTRLKNSLACLDDPECQFEKEEGVRMASYDRTKRTFVYKPENGQRQEATFGEIVTDLDWDVRYHLDKNTVPRNLLKEYLIERAKSSLNKLLDSQIIESEIYGNTAVPGRKKAYQAYKEDVESGVQSERSGFIAEKVVKNMLRKMVYDGGADFKVIEADVFQDVEQKIDFIIRLVDKKRGVKVTADETRKDVGIQFTLNYQARRHKEAQIKKSKQNMSAAKGSIDDIVLVAFPSNFARAIVEEWKKSGCPAGGPDKFLYRRTAGKLFRSLMKNLLPDDQINQYWQEFREYFQEEH